MSASLDIGSAPRSLGIRRTSTDCREPGERETEWVFLQCFFIIKDTMSEVVFRYTRVIDSRPLSDLEEQDIGGRKAMGFGEALELRGGLQ